MIVYKYLTPSRFDVLENGQIRFTQPTALNDPFECMPCFTKFKKSVMAKVNESVKKKTGIAPAKILPYELNSIVEQGLLKIPEMMSEEFVLLCLSKVQNNLLMWSHYTDSHKGFVVGFDSLNPFFHAGSGKTRDGLKKVHYSNKRINVPLTNFKSLDDPKFIKSHTAFFFTKSSDWKYEKEVRIISYPNVADLIMPSPDHHNIYLYEFPSDCVKEIIFGHRMSYDLKRNICGIVEQKYFGAQLYQAILDEKHFQLRIIPFAA